MSESLKIKIAYKQLPDKLVDKGDLSTYKDFDTIKHRIIEKSKNIIYKSHRVTEKDKFVLKIEKVKDYDLSGLEYIWDSDTYNYFYERIKNNPPEKMKLYIEKINEYPKWNCPLYLNILKNSMQKNFSIIKNEIKTELTDKYLNGGKRTFIHEKKEKNPNLLDDLLNELHFNIICNKCLNSNFSGPRYICSECTNFNLCDFCQENARIEHNSEHTFIKLNTPVSININKYNSIFAPNKMLLNHQYEPFEIKVDIVNNGEENLKGCFISPIRFGKKYLGCLKKTICEDCLFGDRISLNILIKFEDDDDEINQNNIYEGYFRLMTKEGIPFGDIFYIQIIIENE